MKSVRTLDGVLDLERFGFIRVEEKDENKILNLFSGGGRLLLFKKVNYIKSILKWYVKNVTLGEVKRIYAKHNMVFSDIVWVDNQKNKSLSKTDY